MGCYPGRGFHAPGPGKRRAPGSGALFRADGRVRRAAPRRSVHSALRRRRRAVEGTRALGGLEELALRFRRRSARRAALPVHARRGPEVGCRAAGRRAEGIPVPYRRSGGDDLAATRGQRRHRRGTGFPARPRRPGGPCELQGRLVRGLGRQRAYPAHAASGEGDARPPRCKPLRRVQPLSRVSQRPAHGADRSLQGRGQALCRAAGRGGALRAAPARRRHGRARAGATGCLEDGPCPGDAAAACLRGAAGFQREAHLSARQQGCRVSAGDAHRSRLQRARATRCGRPRAPEEREQDLGACDRTQRQDGGGGRVQGAVPGKSPVHGGAAAGFPRRRRARAREQGGVPACHRHRRLSPARQVPGTLRHPRVERRARAAGHGAQRRARPEGAQGPASGDRREGRRQGHKRALGAPHRRRDADHPALPRVSAQRRGRPARSRRSSIRGKASVPRSARKTGPPRSSCRVPAATGRWR